MQQYRRYQAPRESGAVFCDPPWDAVPQLALENAARLKSLPLQWGGCPFSEAVEAARRELWERSSHYTREYRDVSVPSWKHSAPLFLLTGHQPRLFHPGVWYKNFVLARLAGAMGAVAVHVVIDNDSAGSTAIRVPAGSLERPHLESVLVDRPSDDVPFEERAILDEELFRSFGARVLDRERAFLADPLVRRWWPSAVQAGQRVNKLGEAVAQARHKLEGEWGLQTCELPLSQVCETASFRRFLAIILADLPLFRTTYNDCLQEFRRINHVRSQSHPVPRLDEQDGWLEAPFWIWTSARPQRQRLFVRRIGNQVELTDRTDLRVTLPLKDRDHVEPAVPALEAASAHGLRLRPRALMTTMYLRLLLCDLFLHGIGGGKYDQMTDDIIRLFFGIAPPSFLVLSATLQLPVPRPPVHDDDLRELDLTLRDLTYNPDRHVSLSDQTRPWVAMKRKWLAASPAPGGGARRHAAICEANEKLQPYVAEERQRLVARRDELVAQLRTKALLGSREFSFCLFPEETLLSLLLDK